MMFSITKRGVGRAAAGAVATVLAAAGLSVAAAPAAQADSRDCPDRHLCLWGDQNYTGRYVFVPQGSLDTPNIGNFMNDLTTSIWNRTGRSVCLFNDTNYGGEFVLNGGAFINDRARLLEIRPGESRYNIGELYNDRISSYRAC